MKVVKRRNFPDRQYRDALVGFGPENTHFLLELRQREQTHKHLTLLNLDFPKLILVLCFQISGHDSNNVFIGTEFGHFGIATQDVGILVQSESGNFSYSLCA